jgi:hypothetical protein
VLDETAIAEAACHDRCGGENSHLFWKMSSRHSTQVPRKKTMRKDSGRPRISKRKLEEMVEAATVDCYNESEQITGWFTMIDDNLAVPFQTVVLGVPVTVERVDLDRNEQIVAVCRRGRDRQSLPILDLPLPKPPPEGAEWIEAFRRWLGEG